MFNSRAKSLLIIALVLGITVMGFNYITGSDNPISKITSSLVSNITNMSIYDSNSAETSLNSLDKMERDLKNQIRSIENNLDPDKLLDKAGDKLKDVTSDIKRLFD